jgi:hypothetical protein
MDERDPEFQRLVKERDVAYDRWKESLERRAGTKPSLDADKWLENIRKRTPEVLKRFKSNRRNLNSSE